MHLVRLFAYTEMSELERHKVTDKLYASCKVSRAISLVPRLCENIELHAA